MNSYDITVVIPVYNSSSYIKKTIKSLVNQNYDFRKIEVLLIDDGSKDNSLDICRDFQKKYSNIKVFSHENHGVSYTRNVGINNANGSYIMFLDADDYISSNTVSVIIDFFDDNYDKIDILTYPIYYDKNGKITEHPKNNFYPKTDIYAVNGDKFYNVSTVNYVIKNRKNSNLLFREDLKVHEDLEYAMRTILEKGCVGYVKQAAYYYVKHDDSAVSTFINPYYTFESWISTFEGFFLNYRDELGKPLKYIQHVFLNELNWKLLSNLLYPVHYNDKKLDNAIERIKTLVNQIEDSIILKNPNIDKFHKYYFLNMKENEFKIKTTDYIELYSNNKLIAKEKDIEIVLTGFKVLNDKLLCHGYFKSYLFNFIDPKFYITVDRYERELSTKLSTNSCYKTKYKTNNFYHFDVEIDINTVNRVSFKVEINDRKYPVKYYYMPYIALNKTRDMILYKNKYVGISNNDIVVNILTDSKIKEIKKQIKESYKKINKKINFFRSLSDIAKHEIWLYNDKSSIIDNGYYQFKHDFNIKDGIKKYYIINDDKKTYKDKFTKQEMKYVVKYKSFKHKFLYLNATKILTSFRNLEFFSPFHNNLTHYRDVIKYELIYLQHGILHCHTPWIYSKEANEIDKIVISSNFEYDNFIDNYNFTHKDLIKSGMSRFDLCNKSQNEQKRFIIALSWRNNLVKKGNDEKYLPDKEKFIKSKFYREVNSLINDKKLNKLLKDNNIILDFSSHPIFRIYDELYQKSANINFIKEVNPSNYDLIITDYSSFVFDYVYLNCDVMYFVPDYDLYKAGITHLYSKLDLPLEDGFGPFCDSKNKLMKQINNYIKNGYKQDKKYMKDQFFIQRGNHREALYQELVGDKNV